MLYILSGNNYELTNYLLDELNDSSIKIIKSHDLNRYRNWFVKYLAKIAYILKIKVPYIFCKNTRIILKDIKQEDKVLIWDIISPPLVYGIKKNIASHEIKLWIWNTIDNNEQKIAMLKSIVQKIYTFDKNDAEKFNLGIKKQLCYDYTKYKIVEKKEKSDIYFVGVDKGRASQLIYLYNYFFSNNLSCDFHLIPDKETSENIPSNILSKPLSFIENIEHTINCNCLLELVKDGQVGLTMRALEAVCAKKKLITNNKDIINYSFYNKNYIFILDKDNKKDLISFIKSKIDVDDSDRNEYLIENWIKEFI